MKKRIVYTNEYGYPTDIVMDIPKGQRFIVSRPEDDKLMYINLDGLISIEDAEKDEEN